MRAFLSGLILCLTALPLWASERVTGFTLENGMEVVVIEDHRAPVVVHMVWYKAGSADEPPGSSGVAHFLEHLLFKGTDTLAPGEFSSTVARHGGSDNAFTSYDYTAYFQRIAADRLEMVMRMEADRMVNLRLGEAEIATERDVILEERNQRTENNPGALFREQLGAAQYLNHRYGVPVIGWKHEMETLDLDDALGFYRTHYAPNNAVLVVAGDVTVAEVRGLAQDIYGALPANAALPPRERASEPPQRAARRLVYRDPRVTQPMLQRAYLAPERNPGDQAEAAALTVLAALLGDGNGSVLVRELQFERQVAVHAGAYYRGLTLDPTSFDFVLVPAPGVSLQEAETALDETLAAFLETGVDADHMARIKQQIRASEIYALDDISGLANRYGRALSQGLSIADVQAWPDVLEAVSAEDVMAAARALLRPARSVTGWMTPEEDA